MSSHKNIMSEKINNLDNKIKGLIYILIFGLFLAITNTLLKSAGHIPVAEKTVYRNGICAIAGFIAVAKAYGFKDKSRYFGNKQNILGLSIRTICGILGITANLYALQYLILSTASVLQDLSVFFVVIFSFIFLREKIRLWQIILICVGFLGALVVINPTSVKFAIAPALAAIFGAAMNGGDAVSMRFLGKKASPSTVVFFYNFVSAIILTPFMLMDYKVLSLHTTIFLILAGVFYTVVDFTIVLAYKYAPGREIAIFSYVDVVFSAALGFIVFGTFPKVTAIIGYVIIIAAAILLVLYNFKVKENTSNQKHTA